jgi:hypothetical protein
MVSLGKWQFSSGPWPCPTKHHKNARFAHLGTEKHCNLQGLGRSALTKHRKNAGFLCLGQLFWPDLEGKQAKNSIFETSFGQIYRASRPKRADFETSLGQI